MENAVRGRIFGDYVCHPITFEDRVQIETIRLKAGHTLSAHAFTSMFLWKNVLGLSICLLPDAYFIRVSCKGENAWFFPVGKEAAVLKFLHTMLDTPGFRLRNLRQEDVDFLALHFPGRFQIRETREDAEYLYLRQAQVELKGGAYKNIRNKINRVKGRGNYEVVELQDDTLEAAKEVVRMWRARRPAPGDLEAAMMALEHWDTLKLQGILLQNDAGYQALAAGAMITPDTFDLHVTKTLSTGLEQYLKWELYRRLPGEVLWINQEDDMDIPGLRTTKTESVPARIVPLWEGTAI